MSMNTEFTGKIVVITGGARGIGQCIAEEFIKAGAKVAVIDKINKNETGLVCDLYFCGDIADEQTLINFTEEVNKKFGRVDYLINNACLGKGGILSDCGYDDFLYVQKVGVVATYMLAKLFLPCFSENASIVNISSTRSFMSQPNSESYTSAKGGISSLTHALAASLAGRVRVNCIAPGWIDTSSSEFSEADNTQHPAGRIGKPVDIARAVMFLCGESGGFITGETITVDGGMTKLMIYHGDCGWNYEPE